MEKRYAFYRIDKNLVDQFENGFGEKIFELGTHFEIPESWNTFARPESSQDRMVFVNSDAEYILLTIVQMFEDKLYSKHSVLNQKALRLLENGSGDLSEKDMNALKDLCIETIFSRKWWKISYLDLNVKSPVLSRGESDEHRVFNLLHLAKIFDYERDALVLARYE